MSQSGIDDRLNEVMLRKTFLEFGNLTDCHYESTSQLESHSKTTLLLPDLTLTLKLMGGLLVVLFLAHLIMWVLIRKAI